jgi:predicted RNA binding protein YcfA (HicA-like mRNA interferase family)
VTRRLPALRPRRVIRALERAGFSVDHVTGAHHILYHQGKPHLRVTVAFHNRDIKPKTLRSIIRQAGLTVDEFIDLL